MPTPKKPGNKLSASERKQVTKSNKAVRRRRDITAGAKQGGLQADTQGLQAAERDLDKINSRTGMSAAEQAAKDAEGSEYQRVSTREEVATGQRRGQQFKGYGGRVFAQADERNAHNRRFIRDMMQASTPIAPSMHKDLEMTQRAFETTKDPATRESARKKVGRILQAGAIDPSKLPNGTACQTPNCPNSTKDDVVCSTCLGGEKGSRTEGMKTAGTKMQTADVAGASYRDKPAAPFRDRTKTKTSKPGKAA